MFGNSIVEKRDWNKIILLTFVMMISMIFELLGIGLIPVYVFSLSSTEQINKYIPEALAFLKFYEKEELIIIFSTFLVCFFLLKNAIQILAYKSESKIISKLILKNSSRLFNYYINKPLQFHYERNPSELIKNITLANRQAGEQIRVSINIFKELCMIFFIISLLLYVNYKITISLFILLILFATLFYLKLKKPLIKMGNEVQIHQEEHLKILNQSFNGIREVKIFKNENFMNRLFDNENYGYLGKDYLHEFYIRLPRVFFELIATILIVIFVLYLMQNNSFTDILPLLSLYTIVLIRFVPSFTALNSSLNTLSYHKQAYKIISLILGQQLEESKNENQKKNKKTFFDNKNKFEIELKDVNFSYSSRKGYQVLNKINLKVFQGDILGIFGKSGTGKSTIIDLIMGLIKPEEGMVSCNGKNINLDLDSWFDKVGYVPQNIYLFDESLLKNITFGHKDNNINTAKLNEVIQDTNLNNFIQSLPEGLNTKVGNMGSTLSGGQRQRIGFARALYKNPDILILDEATNSVDKETEKEILINLSKTKFNKKIIILISHNLRVLKLCNKAIFLKDKKILKQIDQKEIINLDENNLNNFL